jgi:hypothetical protein
MQPSGELHSRSGKSCSQELEVTKGEGNECNKRGPIKMMEPKKTMVENVSNSCGTKALTAEQKHRRWRAKATTVE